MRFARSSHSLRDFVYFIDESLGMKIVPERLRASGRNVVAHNDRFPPGTDDITWLTALAGTGYILLTKDGRIRRRPLERLALRAAKLDAFFLGNRQLRGPDMAEALVRAQLRNPFGEAYTRMAE